MKTYLKAIASGIAASVGVMVLCSFSVPDYDTIKVAAPFPMPAILIYHFPHQDFNIADYGAKVKGAASDSACIAANTGAFRAAMGACHEAGADVLLSLPANGRAALSTSVVTATFICRRAPASLFPILLPIICPLS